MHSCSMLVLRSREYLGRQPPLSIKIAQLGGQFFFVWECLLLYSAVQTPPFNPVQQQQSTGVMMFFTSDQHRRAMSLRYAVDQP